MPYLFSVCTLFTNAGEYRQMKTSFLQRGFDDENTEFLEIDNTQGNSFDAYSGIREFIGKAAGRYIVVCHQDVELVDDGFEDLQARLLELDAADPQWAVAGNAGMNGLRGWAVRITDPLLPNVRVGNLPAQVESLDENFLVIRRSSLVAPSSDLRGFHFYGLDLCLQAWLAGHRAYVIDFHLEHKSGGEKSESYYVCRGEIEQKYARLTSGRVIRTTCDFVFLGWLSHISFLRRPLARFIRLF